MTEIIQSDRDLLADIIPWVGDGHLDVPAGMIAAYRKSLLSDDRAEEVARAMYEERGPRVPFDDMEPETKAQWLGQSRAFLKGLRGEA